MPAPPYGRDPIEARARSVGDGKCAGRNLYGWGSVLSARHREEVAGREPHLLKILKAYFCCPNAFRYQADTWPMFGLLGIQWKKYACLRKLKYVYVEHQNAKKENVVKKKKKTVEAM